MWSAVGTIMVTFYKSRGGEKGYGWATGVEPGRNLLMAMVLWYSSVHGYLKRRRVWWLSARYLRLTVKNIPNFTKLTACSPGTTGFKLYLLCRLPTVECTGRNIRKGGHHRHVRRPLSEFLLQRRQTFYFKSQLRYKILGLSIAKMLSMVITWKIWSESSYNIQKIGTI